MLLITSYSSQALSSKTSKIINGNAPYLTFDGGRTRVTNTDGLLGIYLSNGDKFTPTTNNSSYTNPIELPEFGQSFADIGMLVPTDIDSIELNSLIAPPYNYWGDDDGDGQGVDGVMATGSLRLSIYDKYYRSVARSTPLNICNAPYQIRLSNTRGTLKTSYGVPNESRFSEGNTTYYISPKVNPDIKERICFAKPNVHDSHIPYAGPPSMWDQRLGFIPQSTTPSSYGLNFPTSGANGLYFDLDLLNVDQPLEWKEVSPNGDIKATMSDSTNTSVRVTLTGPVATESQWNSSNPENISRPSMPQVFELVGRDSNNKEVVKYGFVLKQWFVNRGGGSSYRHTYASIASWCTNFGYRLPKVKDLTNASCSGLGSSSHCQGAVGATPSSSGNYSQRRIAGGLFSEWGNMIFYKGNNFTIEGYWTSDEAVNSRHFTVDAGRGSVGDSYGRNTNFGLCVYP